MALHRQLQSLLLQEEDVSGQNERSQTPPNPRISDAYGKLRWLQRQTWDPAVALEMGGEQRGLLVLAAERSLLQGDYATAEKAARAFLLRDPPKEQFYCRAVLVLSRCEGREASLLHGAERLRYARKALRRILSALDAIAAKERYKFLVYNASVHFWHTVRPFLRAGTATHVVEELREITEKLEATGDDDLRWRVQLLVATAEALEDANDLSAAVKFMTNAHEIARKIYDDACAETTSTMIQMGDVRTAIDDASRRIRRILAAESEGRPPPVLPPNRASLDVSDAAAAKFTGKPDEENTSNEEPEQTPDSIELATASKEEAELRQAKIREKLSEDSAKLNDALHLLESLGLKRIHLGRDGSSAAAKGLLGAADKEIAALKAQMNEAKAAYDAMAAQMASAESDDARQAMVQPLAQKQSAFFQARNAAMRADMSSQIQRLRSGTGSKDKIEEELMSLFDKLAEAPTPDAESVPASRTIPSWGVGIAGDLGLFAGEQGNIGLAEALLKAADASSKSATPGDRIRIDFLRYDLMARNANAVNACGAENERRRDAVRVVRRVEALKGLERTLLAARRLGDSELLHVGAVLVWNVCLDGLLRAHLRRQCHSSLALVADILEALDSPMLRLRAQVHYEVARCEVASDFVSSARAHVEKALKLDYGEIDAATLRNDDGEQLEPETPLVDSVLQLDLQRRSEALRRAETDALRPLDRHLEPLLRKLTLRSAIYEEPENPEERALLLVEQGRQTNDPGVRKSVLSKAAFLLTRPVDRSDDASATSASVATTVDETAEDVERCYEFGEIEADGAADEASEAPPQSAKLTALVWFDLMQLAWDIRELCLVRLACVSLLDEAWHEEKQREMLIAQAVAQKCLGEVFAEMVVLENGDHRNSTDPRSLGLRIDGETESMAKHKRLCCGAFAAAARRAARAREPRVVEDAGSLLLNYHLHVVAKPHLRPLALPELRSSVQSVYSTMKAIDVDADVQSRVGEALALLLEAGNDIDGLIAACEVCLELLPGKSIASAKPLVEIYANCRAKLFLRGATAGKAADAAGFVSTELSESWMTILARLVLCNAFSSEAGDEAVEAHAEEPRNVPEHGGSNYDERLALFQDAMSSMCNVADDESKEIQVLRAELWARIAHEGCLLNQSRATQQACQECLNILPGSNYERKHLPQTVWRWLSVAEIIWARAVAHLIRPSAQSAELEQELRTAAFRHVLLGAKFGASARLSVLVSRAARTFWRVARPMCSSSVSRQQVFPFLKELLEVFVPLAASADDAAFLLKLFLLLSQCYADNRDWRGGAEAVAQAFQMVPAPLQQPLWEWRVVINSKLGLSALDAVGKMKVDDPVVTGKVWATLARNCTQRRQQLNAFLHACDVLGGRFEQVELLLTLCEWTSATGLASQDGLDYIDAANDIIMQIDLDDGVYNDLLDDEGNGDTDEDEDEEVPGAQHQRRSSVRQPSVASRASGKSRFTAAMSKRSTKSRRRSSVPSQSILSASTTEESRLLPSNLQLRHLEAASRANAIGAILAQTPSQQTQHLLMAVHYMERALRRCVDTENDADPELRSWCSWDPTPKFLEVCDGVDEEVVSAASFDAPVFKILYYVLEVVELLENNGYYAHMGVALSFGRIVVHKAWTPPLQSAALRLLCAKVVNLRYAIGLNDAATALASTVDFTLDADEEKAFLVEVEQLEAQRRLPRSDKSGAKLDSVVPCGVDTIPTQSPELWKLEVRSLWRRTAAELLKPGIYQIGTASSFLRASLRHAKAYDDEHCYACALVLKAKVDMFSARFADAAQKLHAAFATAQSATFPLSAPEWADIASALADACCGMCDAVEAERILVENAEKLYHSIRRRVPSLATSEGTASTSANSSRLSSRRSSQPSRAQDDAEVDVDLGALFAWANITVKLAALKFSSMQMQRDALQQSGKWDVELASCVQMLRKVRGEVALAVVGPSNDSTSTKVLVDSIAEGAGCQDIRHLHTGTGQAAFCIAAACCAENDMLESRTKLRRRRELLSLALEAMTMVMRADGSDGCSPVGVWVAELATKLSDVCRICAIANHEQDSEKLKAHEKLRTQTDTVERWLAATEDSVVNFVTDAKASTSIERAVLCTQVGINCLPPRAQGSLLTSQGAALLLAASREGFLDGVWQDSLSLSAARDLRAGLETKSRVTSAGSKGKKSSSRPNTAAAASEASHITEGAPEALETETRLDQAKKLLVMGAEFGAAETEWDTVQNAHWALSGLHGLRGARESCAALLSANSAAYKSFFAALLKTVWDVEPSVPFALLGRSLLSLVESRQILHLESHPRTKQVKAIMDKTYTSWRRLRSWENVNDNLGRVPDDSRVLCFQFAPDWTEVRICLVNGAGSELEERSFVVARYEMTAAQTSSIISLNAKMQVFRSLVSKHSLRHGDELGAEGIFATMETPEPRIPVVDEPEQLLQSIIQEMDHNFGHWFFLDDASADSSNLEDLRGLFADNVAGEEALDFATNRSPSLALALAEMASSGQRLIIMPDPRTITLPWEALPSLLQSRSSPEILSVTRELGFHMLLSRLAAKNDASPKADPAGSCFIVDPLWEDRGIQTPMRSRNSSKEAFEDLSKSVKPVGQWCGIPGWTKIPSTADWEGALATSVAKNANAAGSFLYYGPCRLGAFFPPCRLPALDLTKTQSVVLLDRYDTDVSFRRQLQLDNVKGGSMLRLENPEEVAALLSFSGVASVTLPQWAGSAYERLAQLSNLRDGLNAGASVADLMPSAGTSRETKSSASSRPSSKKSRGSSRGSQKSGRKADQGESATPPKPLKLRVRACMVTYGLPGARLS